MTNFWNRIKRADTEIMVFLILSTTIALLMRVCLFPHVAWDYKQFLHPWFETMQSNGGILASGMKIGDYMPPYFYILGFLTYLPIPDLYSIKIVSCIADIVLAAYVMKLVNVKQTNPVWGVAAYTATLFLPDVFLNSAAWGQCDAIFSAALLAFVYYLMVNRPNRAVIAFTIAFVFKLQAIFLAPLLVLYLLKRRVKLRSLLYFPLVYLASILPAVLFGRSLFDLLTVYISQSGLYSQLCMNLPNVYSFLGNSTNKLISQAGVFFAGGVVLLAIGLLYKKRFDFSADTQVLLALFFALLVPFVLPHMHERYYYLAAVLSLVYGFFRPTRFWVPLLVCGCSTYAITTYLFGVNNAPLPALAVVIAAVLAVLVRDFKQLAVRTANTSSVCEKAAEQ